MKNLFIPIFFLFSIVCDRLYCQNSNSNINGTIRVVKPSIDSCVVKIASKTGGSISIEEMVKAGAIEMMKCSNLQLLSFDLSLVIDGTLYTESANGNRFTSRMTLLIKKCPDGTKIYVENIKVKGLDGVIKLLKGAIFVISDEEFDH